MAYQSCWASFKCHSNMVAQYKILEFSLEGGFRDVLTFYEVNTKNFEAISGSFENLNTWISLDDFDIWVDFRTDASSQYDGFKIELRCIE